MPTKKKTTQDAQEEHWSERVITLIEAALRTGAVSIAQSLHERVTTTTRSLSRRIVSWFLAAVGIIFVCIGVAQLLGQMMSIGVAGGYMLVGVMAVCVAWIIHYAQSV